MAGRGELGPGDGCGGEVVVLFNWWERSGVGEQTRLAEDLRVVTPVLRLAGAEGYLSGPDERAAAAREPLEALERMQRILGLDA